jgi:transcriptional regulator PpsR
VVLDGGGVIQDAYFGEKFSGGVVGDWAGNSWAETVTPATRAKIERLLEEANEEGISRARQVNHPLPGGREVPVRYTAVRLGSTDRLLAIGRDLGSISELQQRLVEAQQAMERDYWRMRHIETRYRLLFRASSEAVLLVDADGREVVDANPAAAEVFGETSRDLLGRTFPFGVEEEGQEVLEEHLSTVRARGDAGPVRVTIEGEPGLEVEVSATLLRQEDARLFLVRIRRVDEETDVGARRRGIDALSLLSDLPDGFVVTDPDGEILMANQAFLEMAELSREDEALGRNLGRWLGEPGADLGVLLTMLEAHGMVRLFSSTIEGELGATVDVEISAVAAPDAEVPSLGFVIRHVGRRLGGPSEGAENLSAAVEDLTGLVGQVALKDLVKDTVGLVERHFIQAALELTGGNRTAAAELLGMSRQSLYTKIDRYELETAGENGA